MAVAALTRTRRGLVSELELTAAADGRVVNLDNIHTLSRERIRRRVASLSAARMAQACRTLTPATGG